MKLLIGVIWAIATGCLFYFGTDHYVCNIRHFCKDEVTKTANSSAVSATDKTQGFLITDDQKTVYTFDHAPAIVKGVDTLQLGNDGDAIKNAVYAYLKNDLGKDVNINMYYDPNYVNANGVSDSILGVTRLNTLKSSLITEGVNTDKIITSLIPRENMYTNNVVYDGIQICFDDVSGEIKEKIDYGITHKTLYSAFASKEFHPDNTLANYATELKDYLAHFPNKKVEIIGHTDHIGEATVNYNLGLKRAHNVEAYLVSTGIAAAKLHASSKGETQPVVAGDSPEARRKNRRIAIEVK